MWAVRRKISLSKWVPFSSAAWAWVGRSAWSSADPLPLAAHDSNFDPLYLSRLLPNSFALLSRTSPPALPCVWKVLRQPDATKGLVEQLYPLSWGGGQSLITWLIVALVTLRHVSYHVKMFRTIHRSTPGISSYYRKRECCVLIHFNNLVGFNGEAWHLNARRYSKHRLVRVGRFMSNLLG